MFDPNEPDCCDRCMRSDVVIVATDSHGTVCVDCDGASARAAEVAPVRGRLNSDRHTWLVAVYDVDLVRGGPEEGGWYYEAGSLVRVVRLFPNEDHALAYCRRLNARLASRAFGPNQGKPAVSSVRSQGELQAQVCEDLAPAGYPDRRPRYE